MDVHGNLDMMNNLVKHMRLDAEQGFPDDPQAGRFLFHEPSSTLYFCAQLHDGLPLWIPLFVVRNLYRHKQEVAALEWVITHDLNAQPVLVQIYKPDGTWMLPDEIVCDSSTQVTVIFNEPTSGTAILQHADPAGATRAEEKFAQSFTSSMNWVVTHGLGYNPRISVYVGGVETQPTSITYDSSTQATVHWSQQRTGIARCFAP